MNDNRRKFKWPKPQLTYPRSIKHLLRNMLYNGFGQLFDGVVCILTFGLVNTWLTYELCYWVALKNMDDELKKRLNDQEL